MGSVMATAACGYRKKIGKNWSELMLWSWWWYHTVLYCGFSGKMAKRSADREINHDNWDQEDESEEVNDKGKQGYQVAFNSVA